MRALEAIFRAGGYRLATWTDSGVEIESERQRGELGPWSRALTRLAAGGLDVAQELDWATVPTLSAPGVKYPVVAVANLCGNSEACFLTPKRCKHGERSSSSDRALRPRVAWCSTPTTFTLGGRWFRWDPEGRYLVGISADTPVLRRHMLRGGDASWVENGSIVIREGPRKQRIAELSGLPSTREGTILFAIQNALIATAIARCCGISRVWSRPA